MEAIFRCLRDELSTERKGFTKAWFPCKIKMADKEPNLLRSMNVFPYDVILSVG